MGLLTCFLFSVLSECEFLPLYVPYFEFLIDFIGNAVHTQPDDIVLL